ncbi:MAG: NPCBM/NEW2 domain-containing protein [Verrucomicrobiaceae bacterium]|nr:NPCBM/NEW2 domain-containing protein [Verrucomicrobiaceae bacterium]
MKFLLALALLTTAAFAQPRDIFDYTGQNNVPAGTKRLVFIAAKGNHGGGGQHEFFAGASYLARRINEAYPQAFAVVYPENNWPKDLSKADAIIVLLNHGGRAADDANIKAACDRGAGFAAIHYGVEAKIGSQGKNYLDWMGGFFETFYSVNPTWEASVQPGQHPVANGVKAFSAKDEWYYHMRFVPEMKGVTPVLSAIAPLNTVKFKEGDKPSPHGGNPDVLADVKAGKPQHLAWAFDRPKGGRGFGFTGFHFFANMTNDSFRTTMLNGVAWAAGFEIPANGIATKTPTQAELDAMMAEARGAGAMPVGNAKPVFETQMMTAKNPKPRILDIDVAIKNAKELYLVASDQGSISCDWATWIEPKLIMADGKTIDVTSLKWKGEERGYGRTQIGKNNAGGPIKVEGKVYENGIGTHASSTIAYDLPAGVERFTAKVAIDDGGMERAGKPSDAGMRFHIYTALPSKLQQGDMNAGPPLVPAEMFSVPEGLEVTVWAASPMLYNPTNIDFDAQGRMYVAEGVNYRGKGGRRPEGDRIVILEDTDHDGKADKSSVFVQEKELAAPLGVAVLDDKVVVSQPPDLLVYTDTNGDRIPDKREVLLTGFNGRQHDHSLHSLIAGPDGQWYFNQGNTGAKFTDRSGTTFRMGSPYMLQDIAGQKSDDGHVWIGGFSVRMNPDGTNVNIIGHNYRNSYEQTLTSYGDLFQSDNDDPPACRVSHVLEGGNAGFASADGQRSWGADKRPGQDTPTAEWRQEDPGTMPAGDVYGGGSPTGVAFYENGALGEKWRGLLLACEAGKNVVFGYLPVPDGAGFKLERMDFLTSNKEKEWAGSDFLGGRPTGELKTKFRPSDVCVGPDGAIYVADWFDPGVGGHGTRDDGYTGAIYRIAPKGFKSQVPALKLDTIEGQIAALKSPSINVRNSGFTRLKAAGANAVPAVAALLEDSDSFIAARAAWLLAQMGDEGIAKVKPLLESKDATKRLVAYRALRRANHEVLAMAAKMTSDSDAAVRREVAVTLRDVPAEQSVPILVKIAQQFDGKDRTYLEAFGLGSEGKEAQVYGALKPTWDDAFAKIAWRLHPAEAVSDFKARALNDKLTPEQRKLMVTAIAFAPGREAAGAMLELAHAKGFPMPDLAKWWLMNRKGNTWKTYDIDGSMKALGIYDPDKVKLVASPMPPPPANAPKLDLAEIAKLKGDAKRGATAVATCYTCHHIGAIGVDFGPDLTTYGRQQTADILIQAIAQPSHTISHGYEGSEIKTTDGLVITGMVLSDSDPLIIKCMGGVVQTIPKSRIASRSKLKTSLMYEPSMLGLTPQSIADIVAYLKGL